MEVRNVLSNEMDFRFSRAADCFEFAHQNPAVFTPESKVLIPKGRLKLAKKDTYLWDTDSDLTKGSSSSDFEEPAQLSSLTS